MSRTKKKDTQDKVVWQGYVNVYLTKQEKVAIKNNLLDYAAMVQFVCDAADSGYKFSCSASEGGDFYTATLYGNRAGHPNAGWAMSLKHSDFAVAVSALAHVMGEDGWNTDWAERFTTASGTDW